MKQYAVIGEKLSHTLSPFIHGEIFKHLNISGCNYYVLEIRPENLPNVVASLKTLGYGGVNVTIPYKESIMPYLDEISDEARMIGAVNTIMISGNKAIGYNTDFFGFEYMLKRASVNVKNADCVMFGAGGAAKAIAAYLKFAGASSITVISRNEERLNSFYESMPFIKTATYDDVDKIHGEIAINATPVGMYPNIGNTVVPEKTLSPYSTLIDIVYNPVETEFIKIGKKLGKTTQNGLYMLIDQAIKAEEIFQQTSIDMEIGNKIYESLSKRYV